MRNRYYDPSIGRFTQEDPYWNLGNMIYGDQQFEEGEIKIPDYYAIVQSANLYVYCANDPINGIDPTGMVAYEWFSNVTDAVNDWAWNYYAKTDYSLFEQMSAIYIIYNDYGETFYTYGYAVDYSSEPSNPHKVDPSAALSQRVEGLVGWSSKAIGVVHSHPNSTVISGDDMSILDSYSLDAVYAVVPSGDPYLVNIKVYYRTMYDGRDETTVTYGLRYDRSYLTDKKRSELRQRYQYRWNMHLMRANGHSTCENGFDCPQIAWPRERW